MSVASPAPEPSRIEPSSLTQPYLSLNPASGVGYVGTPTRPSQPSQKIYLPVHSVATSAGGSARSSDDETKHLWLTAATGGFKVEWAKGDNGEEIMEPILIRDSRKNVQSIVVRSLSSFLLYSFFTDASLQFNVDQSTTDPTATIILTLVAIDGS
jgi:hypothetical protein